jgi:hypothetical protein
MSKPGTGKIALKIRIGQYREVIEKEGVIVL